MAAVLTFYSHVLDVRDDFHGQMSSVRVTAARRAVMDRITAELRSAITYPFLQLGLSGQPDEMQFIRAGLPGQGVWAVRDATEDPIPPEHDLQLVNYRVRIVEDESGELVCEGIERNWQKIIAAETAEEGEEIQSALIAPQFKFIGFRYWDNENAEWVTMWESGDLPMAVEIALVVEPLPENVEPEEYPYPTFRRVVYVPGGWQAFGGSVIIRGRGEGRR